MKLYHYMLVFLALTLSVFMLYFIRQSTMDYEYKESVKCENELTSSLLDAVTRAVEVTPSGKYIFNSDAKRKIAYDTFYATLSLNLNNYVTKDAYIQDTIPCLFMVDTDGYYVVFRDNDSANTLHTVISPLNTWTENVGGEYIIRYYLTDYVEIIDKATLSGNGHYAGTTEDVYNALLRDARFDDYISSYDVYAKRREYLVWQIMEAQINYYTNKYNENSMYCYDLTIPQTTGLSNGRCIDEPCMFALMQGEYFGLSGTIANVFAYANAEVTKVKTYVAGNDYYHERNCTSITGKSFYGTMKECADKGFYPCPLCIE